MICFLCNSETDHILTRQLRRGENRSVYYCKDCDLGLLDDYRTEEEIKNYYKNAYRKEHGPNLKTAVSPKDVFESYVDFQQNRLELIEPYLDKEKRLLEIGCSAGMFLYHARDKVKEAVGIEFDQNSAQYASQKCGCEVYTDELIHTPFKQRSFDIICAFQVLEHVKSPLKFLFQVREYLNEDGVLYIEVPNLHDVLVSTYNLPNHQQFYYHSAHLYYFSNTSLALLLAKAGFSGHFYFTQDYNIVNHFNWVLNDRPQSDCAPGLSIPEFPFREGTTREVKRRLNRFIDEVDKEYKGLLSRLELTSNISFIGYSNKK